MSNLSDKDLDRLSQEAAQQHEPGDIVGPRFWEKLEARLDRDLGKVIPNPARGIRRLPYYFAPALLVILGITYYLVRPNNKTNKVTSSGSPPLTLTSPTPANPSKLATSSPNSVPSDKSNSTPTTASNTVPYPGAAGASANAPTIPATSGAAGSSGPSVTTGASGTSITPGASTSASRINSSVRNPSAAHIALPSNATSQRHRHNHPTRSTPNTSTADLSSAINLSSTTDLSSTADRHSTGSATGTPSSTGTVRSPRNLTFSAVRGPVRLDHPGSIDDSALRAFNLATIRQAIHKGGLHINRSLEFGLVGAPDFTSVNSVAGNKAGSTFGISVEYQFANHWYVGSGLLFSRKIFAAAPQDYHVPTNYYRDNGMWMGGAPTVDYIKGRFNMLEIPLDLRYDFNSTGNTLFFASVGTSSYLFTNENCNYYYSFYNRPKSQEFTYTNGPNNLFSTLNLSMGVETGISNSLSLLIAPYFKIPTRNIGFGQVQLNSIGIDFSLRFAPVLSRRR